MHAKASSCAIQEEYSCTGLESQPRSRVVSPRNIDYFGVTYRGHGILFKLMKFSDIKVCRRKRKERRKTYIRSSINPKYNFHLSSFHYQRHLSLQEVETTWLGHLQRTQGTRRKLFPAIFVLHPPSSYISQSAEVMGSRSWDVVVEVERRVAPKGGSWCLKDESCSVETGTCTQIQSICLLGTIMS